MIFTPRLSWLGLKLDPLLTFRYSLAQSVGAAISEPHESRRVSLASQTAPC